MTIYRTHKESGRFMILDKTSIKDHNLSLKAKGLLATMLEKPDGWKFYEAELVKSCKDGKDSVKAGIKELIEAGYLRRSRSRDEKGRLGAYDYDVFETPIQNGKTDVGKTYVGESNNGFSNVGESVPSNNNLSNNDLINNNLSNNDLNDSNDKEQEPGHTNHTNHFSSDNFVDDSQEQKEVELQNMPPMIASYLMKFEIDEIHVLKSALLKAKSSFNSDDDVMAMTLEDIEEHIVNMLKRINQKRKKSNESIESLERYIFTSAKKVFYSNAKFFDDDEPLLDPSNVIVFQGSEITNLPDYERAGAR
ncbi:helix-turn-helix domain-containing protein [Macrococcus hajekii]|uniref:Helix-turn-helix domain-containing protein n=1 Tax=Macrococcus hajekii TaxID=198482 RepID=A0A4R6BIG4_9STAP|nr:helix-turn-helix domain-containing protein [Macrococcus hajekii]TDM01432.1 helix-turn-helix domain-containing protein [Macrococcus hajekii]GGA99929.1 hypothetical protein GCM10007190_04970 [Macrococcus hajekii]